jgi:glycine oxidase
MTSIATTEKSPDLLVIGAGAAGLWTAWKAVNAGLSVTVMEKGRVGDGASGGILGALMPHRPSHWTASKQFQLEALTSLLSEIEALEEVSGVSCGYRRCGRLMPIDSERRLDEHKGWQQAAAQNWQGAEARWDILDSLPAQLQDLMATALAYDYDSLSARLSPRGLLASLAAGVRALGGAILEGAAVTDIAAQQAGHVVVAAGHDSFGLLAAAGLPGMGWGVKGEAVLLRPLKRLPPDTPVLYRGGAYVIVHDDGLVAAGSTSERGYHDALPTRATADRLVADALSLCPALAGAELVESWAGIRPRAAGRQPLVGPLPGNPRVITVTGGFKITLGITHRLADAALAHVRGEPVNLPKGFSPAEQIISPALNPRR